MNCPPIAQTQAPAIDSPAETALPPTFKKTALVAFLTILALLVPLFSGYDAAGFAMDEGMVLVYPELMLHGKLPYRDFETYYGPGNLLVLAGAYAIGGVNIGVERTVGLIYQILTMLAIFTLARRAGLITAVGCTVLAAVVLRPVNLFALAWVGGVLCTLWSLIALTKPAPWRAFAGGLLGAAALLYRQDLGIAVLLTAAPFLWKFSHPLRRRYVAGFAIGLLPLAAIGLMVGPRAMFENLFYFPVVIGNAGRRIPFPNQWIRQLAFFHVTACIVNLTAGIVAWRRDPKSQHALVLLAASILAIALSHQGAQRLDFVHVSTSAFVSIALLPWSLAVLFHRGLAGPIPSRSALVCAVVAVALFTGSCLRLAEGYAAFTVASVTGKAPESISVDQGDRRFPLRMHQALAASEVLTFLHDHSKPGERLFVGPSDLRRAYASDTFLYHLAPWLTPATYFLETNPLSANRPDSRLAADVATADWVVLNHAWDISGEPNASTHLGPDAPNEVVRTQFEFRKRSGTFEIYARRADANTARTAALGNH